MMGVQASASSNEYPIYADDSMMDARAHGTCLRPVMNKLRWGCDISTADRICCFNRHYAEYSGYWESTQFLEQVS